jgi:NAD(P)-dependent dehydrogenase (short-subunit alcohol dehydrogenase family)
MPAKDSPVALITGGAGGIGAAISQSLAGAGFRMVVGYNRSAESATKLAASLPGNGHIALAAPVTDSAALARMAAEIQVRMGRCDVLINCAGTTRFVPHHDLDGLDDALIDTILSTNVRGAFAALRAVKWRSDQYFVYRCHLRDRQQRHVLRFKGGARQHDQVIGACAGAEDSGAVGVAWSGGYRLRQVARSEVAR